MKKTYRKGWMGAMMDEKERAASASGNPNPF